MDALVPGSARGVVAVAALGLMAVEFGVSRLPAHRDACDAPGSHDLGESAASFAVAVGQGLVRLLEAGVLALPFLFAYRHRLVDIDTTTVPAVVALFVATEFVYYWHHRASHAVRWLWATHAVHHSARHLNFTAAIRLGWTGNLTGSFLFFLPLAWVGFDPRMVVAMLGLNLLYQFFIHTEFVPSLGPIEWILNTPAQHRVHHASNASCLDRNFGGVLSIFDRLFGTFATAPEHEPLRYGLAGRAPTKNPLRIALGEWALLAADVVRAPTWARRMRVLFGPPESSHDIARRVVTSSVDPHTVEYLSGAHR